LTLYVNFILILIFWYLKKKDRENANFFFLQCKLAINSSSLQINFLDNNLAVIELRSPL
jgi:hypothetical protein